MRGLGYWIDGSEASPHIEAYWSSRRKSACLADDLGREMPVNIEIRQFQILKIINPTNEQGFLIAHALIRRRNGTSSTEPILKEADRQCGFTKFE